MRSVWVIFDLNDVFLIVWTQMLWHYRGEENKKAHESNFYLEFSSSKSSVGYEWFSLIRYYLELRENVQMDFTQFIWNQSKFFMSSNSRKSCWQFQCVPFILFKSSKRFRKLFDEKKWSCSIHNSIISVNNAVKSWSHTLQILFYCVRRTKKKSMDAMLKLICNNIQTIF